MFYCILYQTGFSHLMPLFRFNVQSSVFSYTRRIFQIHLVTWRPLLTVFGTDSVVPRFIVSSNIWDIISGTLWYALFVSWSYSFPVLLFSVCTETLMEELPTVLFYSWAFTFIKAHWCCFSHCLLWWSLNPHTTSRYYRCVPISQDL